jgi:hypothetical protein
MLGVKAAATGAQAMWRQIDHYIGYIYRLGTWEWFAVLICVLFLGLWCMRGFGSRTEY